MTNLLAETIHAIVASGHSIQDVKHVRSLDGRYAINWNEFAHIANFDYDSGYGAAHIAQDLAIEFQDGSYLRRAEYDGSEWWEHVHLLVPISSRPKAITELYQDYWWDLAEEESETSV